MIQLADRMESVHSDIRGPLYREAIAMQSRGIDVLKLNTGNPAAFGFPLPESIRQAIEGQEARALERRLLNTRVGVELFGDDTPISPTVDLGWHTWVDPFGMKRKMTKVGEELSKGYHIEPIIEDLEEDLDKLRGGNFGVDREKTAAAMAFAREVLGDILPVRLVQPSLTGSITNPLVHLMGMENYYLAM